MNHHHQIIWKAEASQHVFIDKSERASADKVYTVIKRVSVKIFPALNGAVMCKARRPGASRRTGGKLIMWKMRAWEASAGTGMEGRREAGTSCSEVLAQLGTRPSPSIRFCACQQDPLPPKSPTTASTSQWVSNQSLKANLLHRQHFLELIKQIPRELPH